MATTELLSIRIESKLKKQVKKVCKELDIPASLVIKTYLKKFVEEKKITIGYDDTDSRFYENDDFVEVNAPAEEVIEYLKSIKNK